MIMALDYHTLLERAALPIAGVSYRRTATPPASINQWAAQPTPEQEALADQLLADARLAEFEVSGQVVTVTTTPPAESIDLLIGDELCPLPLTDGVGSVEIVFQDGIISRVVRAADQSVYGYREVMVYA